MKSARILKGRKLQVSLLVTEAFKLPMRMSAKRKSSRVSGCVYRNISEERTLNVKFGEQCMNAQNMYIIGVCFTQSENSALVTFMYALTNNNLCSRLLCATNVESLASDRVWRVRILHGGGPAYALWNWGVFESKQMRRTSYLLFHGQSVPASHLFLDAKTSFVHPS